jgi:hypothetical protein
MSMRFSRFGPALVLLLAACMNGGEPSAPSISAPTDGASKDNHGNGIVRHAMGAGVVDLTAANGGYADFQFVAHGRADGTASGHFRQSRMRNGNLVEFSGEVICLTMDPAFPGRARIGGIVTENNSTDPGFTTANHVVGAHVWFRVTDGEAGGDAADASTTYGFKPTLVDNSPAYCALPFTGLPWWNPGSIFPLLRGEIVVIP